MATYNKRGYKTPKEKEVKEVTEEQQVIIDEKDSTTAGVFSKLDETASKTEDWVAKNQKIIIGLVAGIASATMIAKGIRVQITSTVVLWENFDGLTPLDFRWWNIDQNITPNTKIPMTVTTYKDVICMLYTS